MTLGPLLGQGRTSDVYAYGRDSVAKVLRHGLSPRWARLEADLTDSVRRLGVAAPEMRDVIEVDGRPAIVFERIGGGSLWDLLRSGAVDAASVGRMLAEVHRSVQEAGLPDNVPPMIDRLCHKLRTAGQLTADEQEEGCELVAALPRGAALLHGDMHPGNVLMGQDGPVVIDWFDASLGHPLADVVRSSILLRPFGAAEPPHLPGATPEVLCALHDSYLEHHRPLLSAGLGDLRFWESTMAAARLAERAQRNDATLLELWADRGAARPSEHLARVLAAR